MAGMHVVFGMGPIGLALIDQLVADGVEVRAVNRSGAVAVPAGVEVLAGNVADATVALRAAAGAVVLYQCLCPPYHRWASDFPPLQDSIVHAAQQVGARYVSFENTYMYGNTGGRPVTEATPMRATTRKGTVRQAMAQQLADLHAAGELDVVTARASNYFGPRGTDQSPLGTLVIGAALAGKPARVVGDPSQPHSYTFTIDAARTLAALGTRPGLDGQVFHVPNAPATSTNEIVELIGHRVGHPIKVSVAPRALLRIMGVFNRTVRELDEMRYEFTQPFIVDGSKAERELGLSATPREQAIDTTIDWFRSQPTK